MIGEKLKELRKSRNLTQAQLSEKLELSSSAISMYELGMRTPDTYTLELIADYFNVDMNYLFGYSKIKNFDYSSNSIIQESPIPYNNLDSYFPLEYSSSISASSFEEFIDNSICDSMIYVPNNFLKYRKKLMALKVTGESMNNVFKHNSVVVINRLIDSEYEIKNGDIVVAFNRGEATVKRFYKENDTLILMPDSSDKGFLPIKIDLEDELYIIGKVIYFVNPEDIMKYY